MILKPNILTPGQFTQTDVDSLKAQAKEVIDIYESQLEELFRVRKPSSTSNREEVNAFKDSHGLGETAGAWAYYPWNGKLLHCLEAEEFFELRTNRNKNLISEDEQQVLAKTTIGVAGMSVGAGIASGAVYSGISRKVKIADFDVLDTTNLNRLRESVLSVGKKKAHLAAQHLYELDPFLDVIVFDEGLSDSNLDSFFNDPALDLVVDEIDDFKMKVLLRVKAKQLKVPLLMFTSLGDNILVDIERYDMHSDLPLFNGALRDVPDEILATQNFTEDDVRSYSVKLVGAEYVPTKALQSLSEMGRTLGGRPQLYSTIAVDGGLAAYVIRQIVLEGLPESGRYFIKFADLFDMQSADFDNHVERTEILNKFREQ